MDNSTLSQIDTSGTTTSAPPLDHSLDNSPVATPLSNVDKQPPGGSRTQKRRQRYTAFNGLRSWENLNRDPDYPHFLSLHSADSQRPLSNCCSFKVAKEFKSSCESPKQMWAEKDGSLTVEVSSYSQYQRVSRLSSLGGCDIRVSGHTSLNVTKGVVYSQRFLNMKYDAAFLKDELADQKVTDVYQVHKVLKEKKVPTGLFILSFSSSHLPEKIIAGYDILYPRPYVPRPRRCNKCQRFGHIKRDCKPTLPEVCHICAQSPSHGPNCSNPFCCANCGGDHPSTSQDCIKYKFEADVLAMRNSEKISFQEARRRVRTRFIRPNVSFADALRNAAPPSRGSRPNTHSQSRSDTVPSSRSSCPPVPAIPPSNSPVLLQNRFAAGLEDELNKDLCHSPTFTDHSPSTSFDGFSPSHPHKSKSHRGPRHRTSKPTYSSPDDGPLANPSHSLSSSSNSPVVDLSSRLPKRIRTSSPNSPCTGKRPPGTVFDTLADVHVDASQPLLKPPGGPLCSPTVHLSHSSHHDADFLPITSNFSSSSHDCSLNPNDDRFGDVRCVSAGPLDPS